MMARNDLQTILDLLERQQVALSSNAKDAVDRLDHINTELQQLLLHLLQLSSSRRQAQTLQADTATVERIHQLLADNRSLMLRLSDNNRRALQVLFRSEPVVYSRG